MANGVALSEAQDINLHLKPLRSHFEEIEQADFENMGKHLEPMMHVVCLVWANSQYYNTPARIIILLQEICNLIIVLVSSLNVLSCCDTVGCAPGRASHSARDTCATEDWCYVACQTNFDDTKYTVIVRLATFGKKTYKKRN